LRYSEPFAPAFLFALVEEKARQTRDRIFEKWKYLPRHPARFSPSRQFVPTARCRSAIPAGSLFPRQRKIDV
jgi:hypothetical protein